MPYIRHVPAPPLNAYIDSLYYLDDPAPSSRMKVLPSTFSQLMINVGGIFQVYAPDRADPAAICSESWFSGLWDTYHIVEWPQNVRFYGVYFKPGGVYPFLRLPLSELNNQVVSLDAIWGNAAEIRERLATAPSIQAGLALFEWLLLARLSNPPHGLEIVRYAITEIERNHGMVSIRTLSDQIGISQNHLGNQFKRLVGIPPKELARFNRFQHALLSINPVEHVDWTRIAQDSGFYDQPHFNKDFVAFTGHNPTDYLQLRRRLLLENPAYVLDPGPLAID